MGYSCTVQADRTLNATLNKANGLPVHNFSYSNTWEHAGGKYFFERGKEQADGSITGSVFKFIPGTSTCRQFGSLKIAANGNVVRWAGMPKDKITKLSFYKKIN